MARIWRVLVMVAEVVLALVRRKRPPGPPGGPPAPPSTPAPPPTLLQFPPK